MEVVQNMDTIDDYESIAKNCIEFCLKNKVQEPVETLKYIQSKIVTGRKLDIESVSTNEEGDTNFICIDRGNLLQTGFEETGSIKDFRRTLEVQLYEESAVDLGGPRKEFFALILHSIHESYFDPVREFSPDYKIIGTIIALSLLQNGQLPRLLNPELIEEVFYSNSPRNFVKDLRKGLDALGLFQIISKLPSLVHFFTAGNGNKLTMKMLINLLKPNFSPTGSNRRKRESKMYANFLKYLRGVAGGRKSADLRSVLRFVTGAEEEPCLGFLLHPSLEFVESDSFLPTANTCVHRLNLTIPADGLQHPTDEILFSLFDYAFCNQYFGLKLFDLKNMILFLTWMI